MSILGGIVLAVVALFVTTALGDLVSEEVRHRLDALPDALLRVAARRMPAESRDDFLAEWRGELHEIQRGAEALPITRFVRGLRYALGLLRVAPALSRIINRGPTAVLARRPSPRHLLGLGAVAVAGGGLLGLGFTIGLLGLLIAVLAVLAGVLAGVGVVSLSRPPPLERRWHAVNR